MSSIIEFFQSGGVFMYPLTLLSLVTITLVIERMVTEKPWRKRVFAYLEYIKTGDSGKVTIPENLRVEDNFFQMDKKEKEIVITEKMQAIFSRRERVNDIISAIGNTAPLLGFIGTISGMIRSFSSIANADKVSIKLVASGISEALVTTGYGLIIAVTCIMTESLLRYWFVRFSHTIEESTNSMLFHS